MSDRWTGGRDRHDAPALDKFAVKDTLGRESSRRGLRRWNETHKELRLTVFDHFRRTELGSTETGQAWLGVGGSPLVDGNNLVFEAFNTYHVEIDGESDNVVIQGKMVGSLILLSVRVNGEFDYGFSCRIGSGLSRIAEYSPPDEFTVLADLSAFTFDPDFYFEFHVYDDIAKLLVNGVELGSVEHANQHAGFSTCQISVSDTVDQKLDWLAIYARDK